MDCAKIRHDTREGAERQRAQLERRDQRRGAPFRPGHLNVYHCPACEAWHVGHSRKRRKDTA
jgi:hypothetical protein